MYSQGISEVERLVLRLIGNGLSSRQIAELLYISFDTAENYRKKLLHKFAAKNSAELIKKASKSVLLE
jgi:DNA-binding CsgD family transcriptional regulator